MSDSESTPGGVAPRIDRNTASPERQPGRTPTERRSDGAPTDRQSDRTPSERRPDGIDREAMLSLVSDAYARDILNLLGERPLPARKLVDRLDASRATVYRRLDRLESAGIVESAMSIHPEGHHRKEFRIAVERVRLTVGSDGVTVKVTA